MPRSRVQPISCQELLLGRLVGLETEYATLVQASSGDAPLPSRRDVNRAILKELMRRLPTARGRYDHDTLFLANGGAFSIESSPTQLHLPAGLIEGATAEVSSPSQLVQCQRAQDRLLAESAARCDLPARIRVIKNSCDANGHVYGCQENYSAPVASGVWLWLYRGMLLLVLPLALVYWVCCLSILAIELGAVLVLRSLHVLGGQTKRQETCPASESSAHQSPGVPQGQGFSGDSSEETWDLPLPKSLVAFTAVMLRWISLPAAGMLYVTAWMMAFRAQRKYLTSFLVSRVILTGAGHVDRDNRFRLSSKAMAIDAVAGFGGYFGAHPIFVFHHWLQQLCGRSLLSRRSIVEFFHRQQRLQIGLSDSNVSDTAEFLKVGTTSLVLDLIEAGRGRDLPRLVRPIDALHRLASDWDLVARVKTTQGELSGLEIQRAYLHACQDFVLAQDLPLDHEAWNVLDQWKRALEALTIFRSSSIDPRPALGHIDWLTKKWILDRVCDQAKSTQESSSACWAARKKVDIRYHELANDSYFALLREHSPEVSSVDPEGIDHALRMPPPGSPAMRRAQFIREFADGPEPLTVDWSHVVIGTGRTRRVVSLNSSR